MNTIEFKNLCSKLNSELLKFKFKNRMFKTYIFEHEKTFLCLDFDNLLTIQVYNKLYNDEGVAYDLKYIVNSSYRLTTSQNMKVKKLIESFM